MNSSYEKNIVILNVKTSANLFVTRRWVANGGGGRNNDDFCVRTSKQRRKLLARSSSTGSIGGPSD